MAVHLQIPDLPDELHRILRERAAKPGLSLRQYVIEILQEHCGQNLLLGVANERVQDMRFTHYAYDYTLFT